MYMQNTQKFAYHTLLTTILLNNIHTQTTIILYPNMNAVTTSPVIIYNSSLPNSIDTITNKPIQSQSFIQQADNFYCSLNPLYTYIPANQSTYALQYNSTYTIIISNITYPSLQISISTRYGSISTYLNNTSLITCNNISNNCVLQINNLCNNKLNYFNYFDIVRINFSMFEKNVSYNVLCNQNFKGNSFQYGLLVQIVFITGLVGIVAIYSNAWSIGGAGIRLSWLIVLLFLFILVVGGIISIFYLTFIATLVTVLSWIFGIASVWLCSNELLYLLSRLQFLRKSLIKIKTISIRVLDILSIFIGVGLCMAWWFSGKNWILNDVVAVCILIAFIKIFKFTSMKQALICFVMTVSIQIIFVLVIDLYLHNNYNTVILNIFNNPFELQVPTINPVYNQKCSWLPFTAIIYPGILMSYMRRFDDSRNTKIYSITCISMFFIGSFIWLTISIVTEQSFPFGLIAQPATLGFVSLFAWKRKQIRTLWTGKFYDEQFAHKQGLQQLNQSIKKQRDKTQIVYSPDLFTGLEVKDEQSSMQYPLQRYQQRKNKNKQMIDLPFIIELDQQNSNNSQSLQNNLIDKNNNNQNNRYRNQTKIQMVQILSKVITDQQIKKTLQQNNNNNIKKFPQPMQKCQTLKKIQSQQSQLQYNQ